MGIPVATLEHYRLLAQKEPAFASGNRFLDLGSQDVQDGPPEKWYSPRAALEKLGLTYDCIDLDGRHGAWRLDLNVCTAEDVGERYDIIANHGTTEHCFNQYNCFKLIHDLLNVGGLMMHEVPVGGVPSAFERPVDCFYYYSRGFFLDLAKANSYEVMNCHVHGDPAECNGLALSVYLRKVVDQPFVAPIQGMHMGR